jgi:hypothetical protein
MSFFKPIKVAPTAYTTTDKPAPLRNNYMSDEPARTTLFVYLPGNIEVYTSGGLIKKMSENFNTPAKDSAGLSKGIPKDNFFNSEVNAFNGAKTKFEKHAFVIIRLSVAKGDMTLVDDEINGKKVPVYNVNLLAHAESVRGFKPTDQYTPDGGTIHKKIGTGNSAKFQPETEPQATFESPIIKSRR